jgi:hypothetical protein
MPKEGLQKINPVNKGITAHFHETVLTALLFSCVLFLALLPRSFVAPAPLSFTSLSG